MYERLNYAISSCASIDGDVTMNDKPNIEQLHFMMMIRERKKKRKITFIFLFIYRVFAFLYFSFLIMK